MNEKKQKTRVNETLDKVIKTAKVLKSAQRDELVRRVLKTSVKKELADRFFGKKIRDTLGLDISTNIFVQDPMVAEFNSELGIQKMTVKWEQRLCDGPTSSRIAVVDCDGDLDKVYPPAIWDKEKWSFVNSDRQLLDKQKKNSFHFHQVNVWTTIMKVLEYYEEPDALGRSVPWALTETVSLLSLMPVSAETLFTIGEVSLSSFTTLGVREKRYTHAFHMISSRTRLAMPSWMEYGHTTTS